jgi:hypothetical protein
MDFRIELIMLAVTGITGLVWYVANLLHRITGDLKVISRQLDHIARILRPSG